MHGCAHHSRDRALTRDALRCSAGTGQQLLQLWGSEPHSLLLFTEPAGLGGHQALLHRAQALRMRVLHIPLPEAQGLSADDAAHIISTCKPKYVAVHNEQAADVQRQRQQGQQGQQGQQSDVHVLAYSQEAPLQLPLPQKNAAGEVVQAVQLHPGLLQQLELKAWVPGVSAAVLCGRMQQDVDGTWHLGPAEVQASPAAGAGGRRVV